MKTPYSTFRSDTNRHSAVTPLKDAIGALLKAYRIENKYDETYLVASWRRIMGEGIANRTTKLFINDRKLYLQINSAPLKNELVLSKAKIIDILNREISKDLIAEVIFI